MNYEFSQSHGNLNWRKDLLGTDLTENFDYDPGTETKLERWQVLNQYEFTADFSETGNITNKSDAGTYIYDVPGKPHAVGEITGNPGTIPSCPSCNQHIDYTPFNKVSSITEDGKQLLFTYGHDRLRRKTQLYDNLVLQQTKYFLGNYEKVINESTGTEKDFHYLSSPTGLFAVVTRTDGGSETLNYVLTDHLGSIQTITDDEGVVESTHSYGPWGRLRNASTWDYSNPGSLPSFGRGYTGHEHLEEFGLINMNGRLYDPVLGRMLSPDNFVQNTSNSQNFNRYSYALNNPLIYTDPDGEWVWLIPAAVGFATGYISHGATTGDWGWSAVGAGAIGAAVATIGFYSGGATSAAGIAGGFQSAGLGGHAATVALGYSGRYVASAAISSVMPSMSVPVGDNFSVNVSPGVGFGPGGLSAGANISGTYHDGTTTVSAGYGVTGNSRSWSIGAMHNGYGGSYYQTHYGNANGPDGNSNNQIVGGVGLYFGNVSVRLENDFLAFQDPHDRWRSNAVEIGIGNFVVGTNLYNNDPLGEGQKAVNGTDRMGNSNKRFNGIDYGKWPHGKVYSSPLWFGYRNGGSVIRTGWSNPMVQDRTQNWVHRNGFFYLPFGHQNFYTDDSQFTHGPYMYNGYYNPYSLW